MDHPGMACVAIKQESVPIHGNVMGAEQPVMECVP